MKRCDPERLQDWFDGRASEDEARECMAHVAGCAACRERLDGWSMLRSLVRATSPALVPSGPERVFQAPRPVQEVRRIRRSRPWRSWVGVAASLALAFLLWRALSLPTSRISETWEILLPQSASAQQDWMQEQLPLPSEELQT